jgi:hypothetical protein
LPDGLRSHIHVKPRRQKYFAFPEIQINAMVMLFRASQEGRTRRHERWVRDAMDEAAQLTSVAASDGEVVWS